MAGLPKIVDIRDDLRRADEASETDLDEQTGEVLNLVAEYVEDDSATAGTLDQAEEELLRLEEQVDDDVAAERFEAARNRLRIYRDAVSGDRGGLAVIATRRADGGDGFEATVVNNAADDVDGRVTVTFYDDAGEELGTATSGRESFDPGAERTVSVSADEPDGVSRYVSAAERDDAA